jgi:gliding motility associated protien GldN
MAVAVFTVFLSAQGMASDGVSDSIVVRFKLTDSIKKFLRENEFDVTGVNYKTMEIEALLTEEEFTRIRSQKTNIIYSFPKNLILAPDERYFNPDEIVKFRIKEEWVFDKEASRMFTRILGIAPVKTYVDENTGTVLGESPIFWVYYPDLRPVLSLYEVYNGKNFGARMSWEELFESRFFASYVIKSSSENPYDMFVKEYVKDNILRLLEGENIKSRIFNFEQDLWSY